MTYKNKKYLNLSRGKPCVFCGDTQGVVAAHYSGKYAHKLGKGKGIKAWDFCTASLCPTCHDHFDSYEGGNDDARSVEFLLLVLQTMHIYLEVGELKLEVS